MTVPAQDKFCSGCGLRKPILSFGKDRSSPDGHNPKCKECIATDSRLMYANNRISKLAQNRRWYEQNRVKRCAQTAEYARLHPEVRRKSGRSWCRRNAETVAEYHRKYFRENIAKFRVWAKASRERNREAVRAAYHSWRAKLHGRAGFTKEEWVQLAEACGNSCVRCGGRVDSLESIYRGRSVALEVDHIVPLSQGGSGDISNIQPLCSACNNWKRAKAIDFRPERVIALFSSNQRSVHV